MQNFCVGTFYAKPGFVVFRSASLTLFRERVLCTPLTHKGLVPVYFHLFLLTGLKRGVRREKTRARKIGISITKIIFTLENKGSEQGE